MCKYCSTCEVAHVWGKQIQFVKWNEWKEWKLLKMKIAIEKVWNQFSKNAISQSRIQCWSNRLCQNSWSMLILSSQKSTQIIKLHHKASEASMWDIIVRHIWMKCSFAFISTFHIGRTKTHFGCSFSNVQGHDLLFERRRTLRRWRKKHALNSSSHWPVLNLKINLERNVCNAVEASLRPLELRSKVEIILGINQQMKMF